MFHGAEADLCYTFFMSKSIKITINLKIVAIALAAIIIAMLALWQPWRDSGELRKITVAGHARIKAQPDYFQFSPMYQRDNTNRDQAISELNAHIAVVVEDLKKLGIEERYIELQTSAYDQPYIQPLKRGENAVTSHLTVKAVNKELAEKAQEYLLTTSPQGTITPAPTFSEEKRKKLEDEARDKAIADAKLQAERTARQVGAKLGKILEIKDTVGGGIVPYGPEAIALDSATSSTLPILSGEQEISFSVEAIFEIK